MLPLSLSVHQYGYICQELYLEDPIAEGWVAGIIYDVPDLTKNTLSQQNTQKKPETLMQQRVERHEENKQRNKTGRTTNRLASREGNTGL